MTDKGTTIHVADPPKPPVKPIRLLRLSLRLTAERYEHELALVANLRHASTWATDVWLGLPARTVIPNAVNYSLVRYVAAVADECGLDVVVAPRAFAAWGSSVTVPDWYYETCYKDPAYWAWVIQGAKESAAIIARRYPGLRVRTGLDAEVYGDPLYAWLKDAKLEHGGRLEFEILTAIRMATYMVGRVDFGKPWDSEDPESPNYAMRGLCYTGISGKTRRALTVNDLPIIRPPDGITWPGGQWLWEFNVKAMPTVNHVTPAQVLAFDLAAVQAFFVASNRTPPQGVSLHLNACGPAVLRALGGEGRKTLRHQRHRTAVLRALGGEA